MDANSNGDEDFAGSAAYLMAEKRKRAKEGDGGAKEGKEKVNGGAARH